MTDLDLSEFLPDTVKITVRETTYDVSSDIDPILQVKINTWLQSWFTLPSSETPDDFDQGEGWRLAQLVLGENKPLLRDTGIGFLGLVKLLDFFLGLPTEKMREMSSKLQSEQAENFEEPSLSENS